MHDVQSSAKAGTSVLLYVLLHINDKTLNPATWTISKLANLV